MPFGSSLSQTIPIQKFVNIVLQNVEICQKKVRKNLMRFGIKKTGKIFGILDKCRKMTATFANLFLLAVPLFIIFLMLS